MINGKINFFIVNFVGGEGLFSFNGIYVNNYIIIYFS